MRADCVGQPSDIVELDGGQDVLGVHILTELDILLKLLGQPGCECVISGEALIAEGRKTQIRLPIPILFGKLKDAGPLDTLDKNFGVPVGQLQRLHDR